MYLIKPGKLYDFMGKRTYFIVISVCLFCISIASFFYPGPRWGTDFKGGTELLVEFKQSVDAGAVRTAVENIKGPDGSSQFHSAEVIAVPDKANAFLIRVQEVSAISEEAQHSISRRMCYLENDVPADCTPELTPVEIKYSPGGDKITLRYDWELLKLDDKEKGPDGLTDRGRRVNEVLGAVQTRISGAGEIAIATGDRVIELVSVRDSKVDVHLKAKGGLLMDGLKAAFGPDVAPDEPTSTEWIGPKAGAELRNSALKSIGVAMFFIMAYIAFRFDLRFAPGAIVALLHDVIIAVGAMCLARREITLSTVAAILTLLGFSMSDTVVVYDRIRENLTRHRGLSFSQLVNVSVSEMLGRTIITNLTVAVSLLMFLIFGTQLVKDFAFVMLVGLLVGTYSSIYVAAPVTEWVDRAFFGSKTTTKTAKPPRAKARRKADAVV